MKEIRTRVKELKELMTKQRDELQMAQQKVQALMQSIVSTSGAIIEFEKLLTEEKIEENEVQKSKVQ